MTGAPENLQAGSQVGQYILEARLGGGSFGAVWRARHTASGHTVAIKLLTGVLASRDRASMRAEVELLAATASSKSPHVVRVIDGGVDPIPYVVMEFIEGTDLAALLRERGKLPPQKSIEVGLAVADALCALNQAGIIHRDVKPANVMLDQEGTVKLADFGIAKIVGYETITMTGQLPMTMAYAAPEVWEGAATHQSDLYAMGILLFQCLTGTPPFVGNYASLYRQHTSTPPDLNALPPEAPPSLRQVIRLCLEKDPDARPMDAAACLDLLQQAEEELPKTPIAPAVAEPVRFGPWLRHAAHPTQPWAWRCVHEATGEEATVEVHFAPDLAYGAQLRKAVASNPKLVPLGAERLLGTNRLLLRPGEGWHEPPPGEFSFWVAREEPALGEPPTAITAVMLGQAVQGLLALIDAAAAAGLPLSLAADRLTLRADGTVHVAPPGLPPAGEASPTDQALAFLRGLPLDEDAQGLVAAAQDLRDLRTTLAAPAAEALPAQPLELGVAHSADGTDLLAQLEAEDTDTFAPPMAPMPTAPEPAPVLAAALDVEAAEPPSPPHTPLLGEAAAPPRRRSPWLGTLAARWKRRGVGFKLASAGAIALVAGCAALGGAFALGVWDRGGPSTAVAKPSPEAPITPAVEQRPAQLSFLRQGDIWIAAPDGTGETRITNLGNIVRYVWSPDGERVAYVQMRSEGDEVYNIMTVADQAEWCSSPPPIAVGSSLAWSPDGKLLAYEHPYGGDLAISQLRVVDFAASCAPPHEWAHTDGWHFVVRGASVFSPDGKFLVYPVITPALDPESPFYGRPAAGSCGTGGCSIVLYRAPFNAPDEREPLPNLEALSGYDIEALRFSPNGDLMSFEQGQRIGPAGCPPGSSFGILNTEGSALELKLDKMPFELALAGSRLPNGSILNDPNTYGHSWSPDGTLVTVSLGNLSESRCSQGEVPYEAEDGALFYVDSYPNLYLLRVSPFEVTQIAENARDPSWSPDGTLIAYVSQEGDTPTIYTVPPDAARPPSRLFAGHHPRWRPGSGDTRATPTATPSPTSMRTPAPTPTPTATPKPTPTTTPTPTLVPTPTPTPMPTSIPTPTPAPTLGERILVVLWREDKGEIYVVNVDGTGQTNLTNNPADDAFPAWSPDGSKIAFWSQREGNGEIYVMNADGSGQTNLTNNPADDRDLAWSPDGSKIAFISYRSGFPGVYVMNADGSGPTRLTTDLADVSQLTWSPDGSKIAVVSDRDGNHEVYVMNADGRAQTNLTSNPASDWYPAWSPDGSKIVFASDRDGNWEIYTMNPDGSGQTNLTNNPAEDEQPAWSPDGSRIAFISERDGNYEIYAMNSDGSGQTNLTNSAGDDSKLAWSPDGSKIAFESFRDGNGEVHVIDADGLGQTRLATDSSSFGWRPAWSP